MADFSKGSGNSLKDNTVIVVVRDGHEAKDDKGNTKAIYAEAMVDNSGLKKADVQAGKGQANPNLYSKKTEYTDENGEKKTGFEHGIRFSPSQIDAIKQTAGEKNTLEKDGATYYRVKADLMPMTETVKDKDGKPVMGEDGKAKQRMVGVMPNTKTLEPAEGSLTPNRLDKHYANTAKINEVQSAMKAEAKTAKLEASASKSTSAEKSVPEIENEPLPL